MIVVDDPHAPGLHMVPRAGTWTVCLVLRLEGKPHHVPMTLEEVAQMRDALDECLEYARENEAP